MAFPSGVHETPSPEGDPRPTAPPDPSPFADDIPLTASIPTVTTTGDGIDWKRLEIAARAAMTHAYVPYSGFPVGAAALVDDGRVVAGSNIENVSYGLTLCAECSMISDLHRTGGGRLIAFYCVNGRGEVIMPCGRCRQLLHEFHAPGMRLMTGHGVKTMEEILPDAFDAADLDGASAGPR